MKKVSVKWLVTVGMLSSIACVLMLLEFPLPLLPTFLKVDFSDVPALFAAIVSGPLAGVVVQLLKNTINYLMTGSETGIPIGHFSNFISGISFILPAYFIYQKYRTKKAMAYGLAAGTVIMVAVMCVANYYVVIPAFGLFTGLDALTAETQLRQLVVAGILPFNIVKGVAISIVFVLLFSKMNNWLQRQASYSKL